MCESKKKKKVHEYNNNKRIFDWYLSGALVSHRLNVSASLVPFGQPSKKKKKKDYMHWRIVKAGKTQTPKERKEKKKLKHRSLRTLKQTK